MARDSNSGGDPGIQSQLSLPAHEGALVHVEKISNVSRLVDQFDGGEKAPGPLGTPRNNANKKKQKGSNGVAISSTGGESTYDLAGSFEECRPEQQETLFGTVRVWGMTQQFALYWTSNEETTPR